MSAENNLLPSHFNQYLNWFRQSIIYPPDLLFYPR